MQIDAIAEGLDHGHYSRHQLMVCDGLEVFQKSLNRSQGEGGQKRPSEAEEKTQHLRDGEDNLTVGDIQQKLLPHPLAPFLPAFGMT